MRFRESILRRKTVCLRKDSNSRRLGTRLRESISRRKTVHLRNDLNSRHLHRPRRTSPLRYVTLVTTRPALKLESVRTSRRIFSPGKRHISAPAKGRIGLKSRVGAPPDSSRLRGPPRNRKFSGEFFFAVLLYNHKASNCGGCGGRQPPAFPFLKTYFSMMLLLILAAFLIFTFSFIRKKTAS